MKPAAVICLPHWERKQQRVPAERIVEGTPLCKRCFDGHPVDPDLEGGGQFLGKLPGYGYGEYKPPRRFVISPKNVRYPRPESAR